MHMIKINLGLREGKQKEGCCVAQQYSACLCCPSPKFNSQYLKKLVRQKQTITHLDFLLTAEGKTLTEKLLKEWKHSNLWLGKQWYDYSLKIYVKSLSQYLVHN